jgi:hypothetical protein
MVLETRVVMLPIRAPSRNRPTSKILPPFPVENQARPTRNRTAERPLTGRDNHFRDKDLRQQIQDLFFDSRSLMGHIRRQPGCKPDRGVERPVLRGRRVATGVPRGRCGPARTVPPPRFPAKDSLESVRIPSTGNRQRGHDRRGNETDSEIAARERERLPPCLERDAHEIST